jgi:hypothetical protein
MIPRGNEDENEENEILHQIENFDTLSKKEKGQLTLNIVKKYMKLKGIRPSPLSLVDTMNPIVDIIRNDLEFRKWTFTLYQVFIYYDKELIWINKIPDEAISLMNNRGDLTDDELVEKMREVAEKTGFNTKRGLKKTD